MEIVGYEVVEARIPESLDSGSVNLEGKSKAAGITQYCKERNIDLRDVIFVDDVLSILREAERKGIKAYHVSSFFDWEYQESPYNG